MTKSLNRFGWNTLRTTRWHIRPSDIPPFLRLASPTRPPAIRGVPGDCAPQAEGHGPIPRYDNVRGFYHSPEIHDAAASAAIPPGYVQSFASANGSFVGTQYLGHFELQSYNTLACSKRCNEWGRLGNLLSDGPGNQTAAAVFEIGDNTVAGRADEQVCQSFNVYFERSPAIQLGPECRDSTSRTIIKCALWGEPLRIEGATNVGYKEWDFDVAIAGSNGYNLEKYAEAKNMASGKKMSRATVTAIFVTQLALLIMAF